MQAPVAVGLGILYIVFLLQQENIVLLEERVCEFVNVLSEGTYHPDSGYVEKVLLYAFDCQRVAPAYHFLHYALG